MPSGVSVAEPIVRDTVVDALTSQLRTDILGGLYPPGSYLPPERELAAQYQVTRTSLKHAFVRLAQVGLVETRHGVGTRVLDYVRYGGPELLPMLVRTVGPAWMEEIFAVRLEVGALVAAQAARHATAEDRARLRELLAELGTATDAQLAESEIHRMIAAATGNRVYGFLVNSMLNAYLEFRGLFQHAFADPAAAAARITPLIEAIESGDPDVAHGAAYSYLTTTRELMLGRS